MSPRHFSQKHAGTVLTQDTAPSAARTPATGAVECLVGGGPIVRCRAGSRPPSASLDRGSVPTVRDPLPWRVPAALAMVRSGSQVPSVPAPFHPDEREGNTGSITPGRFFSHGNRPWLPNENPRRQCVCCDGGGGCSPHAPTGHRRDEVRHTERRISRGKPITAAPNSGRRNLHKVASRRDMRGLPIPFLLA